MSADTKALKQADKDIVKSQIEQQIEQAKELHKQQMLRRRLELARQGSQNYEMMKFADAAKAYNTYLQIMEDFKRVKSGGLHPGLFDKKKEITELVLISGIYWDLSTIFDRTKSRAKQADFKYYMEKFVQFSLGMQYQPVATETLRKYIANGKPIHKAEFKKAYSKLESEKCFIVTSLVDHCDYETLDALRLFRDRVLFSSFVGQKLVALYYQIGPFLARFLNSSPNGVRRLVARALNGVARIVMIYSTKE